MIWMHNLTTSLAKTLGWPWMFLVAFHRLGHLKWTNIFMKSFRSLSKVFPQAFDAGIPRRRSEPPELRRQGSKVAVPTADSTQALRHCGVAPSAASTVQPRGQRRIAWSVLQTRLRLHLWRMGLWSHERSSCCSLADTYALSRGDGPG